MEYCCHVWAGSRSFTCWFSWTLAHRRNVASLGLFCRYYFGRCSSEMTQLVPLPFSWGRSTCYSDRLHDFSVTIPRCYKDVYVNSFFPLTARLWNSLPIEWLFFCLGFLSQPFTNHRTAGEGRRHFFNSSLPLPPASQTIRH